MHMQSLNAESKLSLLISEVCYTPLILHFTIKITKENQTLKNITSKWRRILHYELIIITLQVSNLQESVAPNTVHST